ncbi:MAG: right-handed parallel beta-helix repeat-containing protein [Flavobacteriales bacterium]|nr:MAG: right-handed parallel beta-helix repeat-containing protein [Flavobacteriales bacterium]
MAYGKATSGGGGGRVIKVTNLNASGPGSLREALKNRGRKIVVFEVGGVIDLKRVKLKITEPNVTIAGQTAPSPGITLIRGGIEVLTHDVIIQHIRVRPGDAGQAQKSGSFEPDGLATVGGKAYSIIVDHCSFTWSVDENLSASGDRTGVENTSHKITFTNNIVAEGLMRSSHLKGNHSMGSLVHDFVQDIAIVGNLYASNNLRNPFFKAFTKGIVVNNVIFNPGSRAIHMSWSNQELRHLSYQPQNGNISVVGNVLIEGPNSSKNLALIGGKGNAYLEDNITKSLGGRVIPLAIEQIDILLKKPTWPSNFQALPADKVINYVKENVGARPKDRDSIDKRIVEGFVNGNGRIINSQDEVGGYPKYKAVYRKLNVPATAIDKWLDNYTREVE